jgi:hypothetical protein
MSCRRNGSVDIGVSVPFEGECSVIAEELNNTRPKQIGPAVIVRESGNPKHLTFKDVGLLVRGSTCGDANGGVGHDRDRSLSARTRPTTVFGS